MVLRDYGMSVCDHCRHRTNKSVGWAKILEIGYFGKTYKIAKCEWALGKNADFGLIKYFALRDLIKPPRC